MNHGHAVNILKRGLLLEERKRYTEALVCYHQGLQTLVDIKQVERDGRTRAYLQRKIEDYMDRAESVKMIVRQLKEEGRFHEQIRIENNSIGHNYMSLFGRFLDDEVRHVRVEDPYIRTFHQCQNFLRVCELLFRSCVNLRVIDLVTGSDKRSVDNQKDWFDMLAADLKRYKIKLNIIYSANLNVRQVLLNSGWIIQIGRGLDIYKPPYNTFVIGVFDLDMRPCFDTTVDVYHCNDLRLGN